MATLKADLKTILGKYGIDPRDQTKVWDCRGTLVLFHRAYEIIAATEGITFDAPVIIESDGDKKIVALLVTGRMGDRSEWSIGEAAPGNSKNAYPYAMAEKRAKDRVVGKLVGLAEHVYSEDEADEFKERPRPVAEPQPVPRDPPPFPGETPAPRKPVDHPRRQEALDAYARIRVALENARLPKLVDEIMNLNKAELDLIEQVHPETRASLVNLALARSQELRAAA